MTPIFLTALALLALSKIASQFGAGGKLVALGFGAASFFAFVACGLLLVIGGVQNAM